MNRAVEIVVLVLEILFLYAEAIYRLIFPKKPRDIHGEIALVTGAGHGIGKELALEFSRRGATVVLWDINKVNNENTAKEIESIGGVAYPYTCDVTSSQEIYKIAEKVREDVGEITILANNAGILNGGALLELKESDIRRTFDVNILAQIWMVREFLPSMMKRNHGYILNIASMSAVAGSAFLVDYSSSKSAVYGFTDALSEELDRLGKTGIQTTVVCPLFVDTGMTKFIKLGFSKLLTPKETAWNAVDGMLRGDTVVFVPRHMWLNIKLASMLPQKAVQLIKKFEDIGIDPQYKLTDKIRD